MSFSPAILPNEFNLQGLYAARPAAGQAGRLYYCTDSQFVFYDTGAIWTPVSFNTRWTPVAAANTFSVIQTAANGTLIDDKGALYLYGTKRVATNDRIFATKALPVAYGQAYYATVAFQMHAQGPAGRAPAAGAGIASYSCAGLGYLNTAGGANNFMMAYSNSGSLEYQKGTASSLVAAASVNVGGPIYAMLTAGPSLWFRMQDNGQPDAADNICWSWSPDGTNFYGVWAEARSTFVGTPNRVGFFVDAFNNNTAMRVYSFETAAGIPASGP